MPQPLVTVVITCYNQAQYLDESIRSATHQLYKPIEILVVNDGSTDETAAVASSYPSVSLINQPNQGLSSARNTGLDAAKGSYILFLDADDWLYPEAVNTNVHLLDADITLAFAAGGHHMVYPSGQKIACIPKPKDQVYLHLLLRNYIAMHAAVLFRTDIIRQFRYDEALRACEDYDLYLRITRNLSVCLHPHILAAYRQHESNMSGNYPLMLRSALQVLDKQEKYLASASEKNAWKKGKNLWKRYYVNQWLSAITKSKASRSMSREEWNMVLKNFSIFARLWVKRQFFRQG
jgi:glycosyltransferase involved in cell wall biosynthesis